MVIISGVPIFRIFMVIGSRNGFPELNLVTDSLYVGSSDSRLAGDQKVIRY